MFDKEERHYESVTPEQLRIIRAAARKNHGKVTKQTDRCMAGYNVRVVFYTSFPNYFASHSAAAFAKAVQHLNLKLFTGMPELLTWR